MQSFFFLVFTNFIGTLLFRKTAFSKVMLMMYIRYSGCCAEPPIHCGWYFYSSNYLSIDIRYSCRYNWCFSAYFHPYFVVSRIWSKTRLTSASVKSLVEDVTEALQKEDPWQYKHEALQIPGWVNKSAALFRSHIRIGLDRSGVVWIGCRIQKSHGELSKIFDPTMGTSWCGLLLFL